MLAKMALAAMFSRSAGLLPSTSLPKMLWPLLAVMAPRISGSTTPTSYGAAEFPATMLLAMSSRVEELAVMPPP